MPIILQSGASGGSCDLLVSDILACVSQDVRQVLSNSGTPAGDLALLIDYTNRISLEVLRFSRWKFLQSAPQLFVTLPGVTDYFVGVGSAPYGTANTELAISNIQSIKRDMVFNRSANKPLAKTDDPPLSISLQLPQRPLFWRNDVSSPYVLNVYPPPDANSEQTDVTPTGPIATNSVGGALLPRVYYVQTTFLDSTGGESLPSVESVYVVPAGQLLTLRSPALEIGGASGVLSVTCSDNTVINRWNAYISQGTPGVETLQATNTLGTDWTEPVTGVTTTGASTPSQYSLAPLGGYVVEFRYFQSRTPLIAPNQCVQVPGDYRDVMCAGVNWLAYKYLKKDDEAQIWKSVFERGKIEMIKDANLFPRDGEFIHPDPMAVHRSINTGIGLDSGQETSIA